jgi:hypothetical protein
MTLKIVKYMDKNQGRKGHPAYSRRKAYWIGDIFRRNCLLRPFIEGKIEGTRRRGRKGSKLLLDDIKTKIR